MEERSFYLHRRPIPPSLYLKGFNKIRLSAIITIGCSASSYPPFRELKESEQDSIVEGIEESCYKHTCDKAKIYLESIDWSNTRFSYLYSCTRFKVENNILYKPEEPKSSYLIKNIMGGSIDIREVGGMSSRSLRPYKTADVYNSIDLRCKQKLVKKYSTQHECSRCGQRKTTEEERQIRALDEGSTIIIKCEIENCGNVWRL